VFACMSVHKHVFGTTRPNVATFAALVWRHVASVASQVSSCDITRTPV